MCTKCNDTGFVTVQKPEVRHGTIYLTDQGHLRWPAEGGKPHRVDYPTGRTITYRERCECTSLVDRVRQGWRDRS